MLQWSTSTHTPLQSNCIPGLHHLGIEMCFSWSGCSTHVCKLVLVTSPSIEFVLGFGGTSHLEPPADIRRDAVGVAQAILGDL